MAHALGDALADLVTQPDAFVAALTDGPVGARRRDLRGGAGARRTRLRRDHRRPLAAHPRDRAGAATRPARRPRRRWSWTWPTDCLARPPREVRLFALPCLRRTLARRPGALVAAAPPHRTRRTRLDQRRLARRGLRPGHPRRAIPLGRAGAAGLLRPAHGTAARRLDARPHAPRGARRPAARSWTRGARWRSSASSWAMPTTRSRRRSRGRSGRGAGWTHRRSPQFLTEQAEHRGRD